MSGELEITRPPYQTHPNTKSLQSGLRLIYDSQITMNAALEPCGFCQIDRDAIQFENDLAFAILDGFPVTPLHALVISKRHIPDYFSLTEFEQMACNELLWRLRARILAEDQSVSGFNIGINAGGVAGQTIFHCHIHLIPRRSGDVTNPRGGVRNLIPGKGNY